ncbi:3-polyprenyl-4-hydroxybenzoate decarboxylase [Eggerthella sp. YY7918]|uniref:3-polyprenyl-4-hydroxybenzoate decarboxylase n=1 Tax=Eggerthella sp. (strain YY7918) TaxID=502558 RepID=UPI0002171352|nr:3-polyprenyl-4-hydroxybenzoate decarboxylase [Eggerthella sp. YY7918]BAK44250.1 3-polyprenyl-4-hydroxybenzoate decarboxylase [Eggerthella sp. YY7918]
MKKRLKWLLVLSVVACTIFGAATPAVASASTDYTMGVDLTNGTLIFPGDTIKADGSGGEFVVIDENGTVIHQGHSAVYTDHSYGTIASDIKSFGSGEHYLVPDDLALGYYAYIADISESSDDYYQSFNNQKLLLLYLKPEGVTYVGTYDPNGGTEPESPFSFKYGEAATAGNVSDGSQFTNGNLVFKSWNTMPDGTGDTILPNVPFADVQDIIAQNAQSDSALPSEAKITFYAQWGPAAAEGDIPPTSDSSSNSPNTGDSVPTSPPTGDSLSVWLPILLMLLALGAGGFALRKRTEQK